MERSRSEPFTATRRATSRQALGNRPRPDLPSALAGGIRQSERVNRLTGGANIGTLGGYRSVATWPCGELVIDPPVVAMGIRPPMRWFLLGRSRFEGTATELRVQAARRRRSDGVRLVKPDGDWAVFWGSQGAVLDALQAAGAAVNRTPIRLTFSDLS